MMRIVRSRPGVPRPDVAGYVLTGGRSSRFGSDKALFPFRGRAMALWVADALLAHVPTVTLVGTPKLHSSLGIPVIPDQVPGAGPLGGIVTALAHAKCQWCLITACDMPMIADAPLAMLIGKAVRSSRKAILPRTPDGRIQPLCAIYSTAARSPLEDALLDGVRKITEALDRLDWEPLDVENPKPFSNINRVDDMQGLE